MGSNGETAVSPKIASEITSRLGIPTRLRRNSNRAAFPYLVETPTPPHRFPGALVEVRAPKPGETTLSSSEVSGRHRRSSPPTTGGAGSSRAVTEAIVSSIVITISPTW